MQKTASLSVVAFLTVAAAGSSGQATSVAIGYDDLLRSAIARDCRLGSLVIEEERATIALERAAIALGEPAISARTGSAAAYFSDSGAGLYASPEATVELPRGTSLSLSVPLGLGAYGDYATPGLSLGVPLVRGENQALVSLEKARAAAFASRSATATRRVTLEKELVAALKAVFAADIDVQAARGAEAKAKRELERARNIDGADPAGIAYRRLERELKAKSRALRDAGAVLADAQDELSALAGPLPPGPVDAILPMPPFEPDLDAALPDPDACAEVLVARENAHAASVERKEGAKRSKIGAKLGASYSSAAGEDDEGDAVYAGLGLSAGVAANFEDFDIGLGAEYNTGAPTIGLSLSWKPARRKDHALRDRDERLAEAQDSARIEEAVRVARKTIAKLDAERRRLSSRAEDAAWELDFAREQARTYAEWRAKGLVGDEEYEEVVALERECASRAKAAALDRALWALELRALTEAAFLTERKPYESK